MTATDMSPRTTRTLRIAGWSLAAALLIAPGVAMMAGAEGVNWSAGDFILAGTVFLVIGGLFELTARTTSNLAYRAGVVFAVACAFLQLWISGAVGIIGDEGNPANWTYYAVVLSAMIASAVAAGRARAMARAMAATMAIQLVFFALHMVDGHMTAVVDLFFAALWLLSARLFARAAGEIAAAS